MTELDALPQSQIPTTESGGAFRLKVILGGVQKAGTTSLFGYMQEHPQLLAPSRKETHFFDNEQIDWSKPNDELLRSFYPASKGESLPFDATPIYLFWLPSLSRIRAHNPHVRLIFLFRDPIERAWSHWRMETRRSMENLPFEVAIREGRQRLRNISPLDRSWRIHSYVERGFYGSQVRRLLALFPREQILLLSARDLERDHDAVLARIASFLDIAAFPSQPARRDHRSLEDGACMREQDIAYLRRLFRDEVREFSQLSGLDVDNWLTMQGN